MKTACVIRDMVNFVALEVCAGRASVGVGGVVITKRVHSSTCWLGVISAMLSSCVAVLLICWSDTIVVVAVVFVLSKCSCSDDTSANLGVSLEVAVVGIGVIVVVAACCNGGASVRGVVGWTQVLVVVVVCNSESTSTDSAQFSVSGDVVVVLLLALPELAVA